MISFIIAMPKEASKILEYVENIKEFKVGDKTFYTGKLFNKDVSLSISGIGKVSAALTTQMAIDRFNPEYVINFGSCGGINNTLEIGKYYIVDKFCQPDFDITEIDNVKVGYIQEYDRVYFDGYTKNIVGFNKVNLASADKFCSKKEFIDLLHEMNCSIRDMEGSAIAQVCTSNNIPLISIKGVTDIYGYGTDGEQFFRNLTLVCNNFPKEIKKVLEQI